MKNVPSFILRTPSHAIHRLGLTRAGRGSTGSCSHGSPRKGRTRGAAAAPCRRAAIDEDVGLEGDGHAGLVTQELEVHLVTVPIFRLRDKLEEKIHNM